ncbi:hypothetical protein ASD25_04655 [Brevundimonas sp. Root1423]|nr:hypothetical protein ASD25_04655 [Brevundimonas sp. Root1423]
MKPLARPIRVSGIEAKVQRGEISSSKGGCGGTAPLCSLPISFVWTRLGSARAGKVVVAAPGVDREI